MSIMLTTGAADWVGDAEGVADAVADTDGEGFATGITFPESQARTVLPLLFALMQV